jgi:formylglycine-generating enzyme required for sulfatase activity
MLENGEPDPRDDIYGLACIAYEMLTGRHPFDRKVATEARDSGLQLPQRSALTAAQLHAISHALEFDRERRTATAEEFMREFSSRASVRPALVASVAAVLVLIALAVTYLLRLGALPWFAAHPGAALTSHRPGAVFRDCPNCPRMKALPAGSFVQGAAEGAAAAPFEAPRHQVAIARPFAIGVYEITVGEFTDFAQATGFQAPGCDAYDGNWKAHPELNWSNTGYPQTPQQPVTCVSWRDARAYAAWLSQKTGQSYRLLTESEWEFAARAGAGAALPWASDAAACASANVADQAAGGRYPGWITFPCNDGYVYTAPVGSFHPNTFGLYDMLGNAAEWVEDCWHPDYQGAPADGTAWQSGDCTERTVRGGSWFTAPAAVSLSARNRFADDYHSNSVGFRLAREMKQ